MINKFTLKFLKYMTIFVLLNFTITCVLIIILFFKVLPNIYWDINEIEPTYLETYGVTKEPNDNLKSLAKKSNVDLYFVRKNGDILYPKSKRNSNIKPTLLKNMNNANSVVSKEGTYLVYIYRNKMKQPKITNSDEIKTSQLLDSLSSLDFNHYNYLISNNELQFVKNPGQRTILWNDNFGEAFNDSKNTYIVLFISFIVVNIILIALTAILISKRLTRPLSFYIDWIGNLSLGKLHQPTSKRKRFKNRRTYPELDASLSKLNEQMLSDKFYHNQMSYYKSKWISQISHDLKSPLTTIYGYSKLIQADEASQSYVQLISEKATFMSDLIDSLNQTFDMETNQMKHDKEKFPIQSTVNRIAQIIGYQSLTCDFHFEDESTFYGNKLYFERLLINLINNSIDHNEINPSIKITFSKIENNLMIDYKDDGQGLPHANIDALFKQSYTSKANKAQHGIGLSIIKDAVNYHHGSITLLPSKQGVHFHIILVDTA
ncbi:sensor histidine kinase [Staphylococcus haemolyticus]|uniref:sensor histidine kinase n=1 Tax=Staphylococcus haemolyticus TaxID=1283 RepID=UPI001F0B1109|nr:HAMP domain-containing sensor histidine kinase [Staphylococcus haemolyticus]MCH4415076.1 HAMP domain-containing histidine kinase [Staphylococcus haemolyticus]MCH4456998.1 HAMP domain-containing histidine kinase [Staphylococcus haemolyticus]